jgi:hypothetical protein
MSTQDGTTTQSGSGNANDNSSSGGIQQSTSSGNFTSGNNSKNRGNKSKKKNKYWNNKKSKSKKKNTNTFTGTIIKMNSHGNQFLHTIQELKSYLSIKLTKYPHDIIFILKHMEECEIRKPDPPDETADRTDTRIWEKEVDKYVDRCEYYKQNKSTLYTVIWAQCSLPMQAKLKSLPEYNPIHRNDDCLGLINSIRAVSMKFESHDYLYKAMYAATKKFFNYRQGPKEIEAEYMANFKDLLDAIIYYGGSLGEDPVLVRAKLVKLDYDMDSYNNMNDSICAKLKLDFEPGSAPYVAAAKIVQEKFFAVSFLMSSDPRRYKQLLIELENDHSKGTGNYPTTLTAAYSLIVNYRTQSFQQNNKSQQNSPSDGDKSDV